MRFRAALAGLVLAFTATSAAWAQAPTSTTEPAPPTPPPSATSTPDTPPSGTPPDTPADPSATSTPPGTSATSGTSATAGTSAAGASATTAPAAGAPPVLQDGKMLPEPKPSSPSAPPPGTFEKLMSGFTFGSYGRVVAGSDFRGRPGRDTDFVARGSRLDESNYAEIELRREDFWEKTQSRTRIVATLALTNPMFHYTGDFDVGISVRNLFLEERDLGLKNLSAWAGSRMYRGDDVYLLDWWPLDGLNTLGGGARYDFLDKGRSWLAIHAGVNRPTGLFYYQTSQRTAPLNQFGATTVEILNRQRTIGSLKYQHIFPVGEKGGIKGVLYGEVHALSEGQRELDPEVFEDVPGETGFVAGAQVGAFTGERDTYLNLFFRYARGIAAYGEFATPTQLSIDRTAEGAEEIRLAASGNFEKGPFTVLLGAYVRAFRNASPALDAGDVDEGAIILRPHLYFGEWGGIAVEGSFQAQQRGVVFTPEPEEGESKTAPTGPLTGSMWRVGLIPFLSPAGRGSYVRPHLRLIYLVSFRDEGAKAFYAKDDVFNLRDVEHYIGFGAEWWFNSTSYGW